MCSNFSKFKMEFLQRVDLQKQNENFNNLIEEIISILKLLKIQTEEKSKLKFDFLSSQMNLIQKSLSQIREELDLQSQKNMHPNLYRLPKILQYLKKLMKKEWEIYYPGFINKKISN